MLCDTAIQTDTHNRDKIKSVFYLTYRGASFVYLKKFYNHTCPKCSDNTVAVIAGSLTDIVFEHRCRFLPSGRPFWSFPLTSNRFIFCF
jgi:hypothetical protein